MSPPVPGPTRGQRSRARRHRQLTLSAMTLLIMSGLFAVVLGWQLSTSSSPRARIASRQATTTTVTPACARALKTAARLATAADPLAEAAQRHLELMERLDLFLEHKPGGLSGQQVYELGRQQMTVFEREAGPTRAQAHRYREVAAECPLT